MDKMKRDGAITDKVFSFSINPDTEEKSAATFGGYDLEKYAKGSLSWHEADTTSIYWSLTLGGMTWEFDKSSSSSS